MEKTRKIKCKVAETNRINTRRVNEDYLLDPELIKLGRSETVKPTHREIYAHDHTAASCRSIPTSKHLLLTPNKNKNGSLEHYMYTPKSTAKTTRKKKEKGKKKILVNSPNSPRRTEQSESGFINPNKKDSSKDYGHIFVKCKQVLDTL